MENNKHNVVTRVAFQELGWTILKDLGYQFDGQYLTDEHKFFDFTYDTEDGSLEIEEFIQSGPNPNLYNSRTIFIGIVTSKEAMQKLMKQLNII